MPRQKAKKVEVSPPPKAKPEGEQMPRAPGATGPPVEVDMAEAAPGKEGPVQAEGKKLPVQGKEEKEAPCQGKEGKGAPVQAKKGKKLPDKGKEEQEAPVQGKDGERAPVQEKKGKKAPVQVKTEQSMKKDSSENMGDMVGQVDSKEPMGVGKSKPTAGGASCGCEMAIKVRNRCRNLEKRLKNIKGIDDLPKDEKELTPEQIEKLKVKKKVESLIEELKNLMKSVQGGGGVEKQAPDSGLPPSSGKGKEKKETTTSVSSNQKRVNNKTMGSTASHSKNSSLPKNGMNPNVTSTQATSNTPAEACGPNRASFSDIVISYSTHRGITTEFNKFLNGFKRDGDSDYFYLYAMKDMIARGSHRVLTVHYQHLLKKDKKLAMAICNDYQKWRKTLKAAATKRLNDLLSCKESLELEFAEMPTSHHTLAYRLQNPLKPMNVHGHRKDPIMVPNDGPLGVTESLFCYAINTHRSGKAWGGFDASHVDVVDRKARITKRATVLLEWPLTQEMMDAMEKDLEALVNEALCRFRQTGAIVPFLEELIILLEDKENLHEFWSNKMSAALIWDLIENHPFFKPPAIRSMLLSAIHESINSFKNADISEPFVGVLRGMVSQDWQRDVEESDNTVLMGTLYHGANVMTGSDSRPLGVTPLGVATRYDESLKSFTEFMRHHCRHATERTLDNVPRQQLTKSLDEQEVGAAAIMAQHVETVLITLAENNAFKGILKSTWEAYKRYKTSGSM